MSCNQSCRVTHMYVSLLLRNQIVFYTHSRASFQEIYNSKHFLSVQSDCVSGDSSERIMVSLPIQHTTTVTRCRFEIDKKGNISSEKIRNSRN